MSTKLLAVASLCLFALGGAAVAEDSYSTDMSVDSNGASPYKLSPKSKVDYTKTGSIKLPSCSDVDAMASKDGGVHTRAGDSGASRTDACRDDSE